MPWSLIPTRTLVAADRHTNVARGIVSDLYGLFVVITTAVFNGVLTTVACVASVCQAAALLGDRPCRAEKVTCLVNHAHTRLIIADPKL